jgi:uncharacterized protein (DUF885 family)
MPRTVIFLAVILILSLTSGSIACAEVYSWVDETGGMHFTDQYSNIPAQYVKKVKVREDINQEPSLNNPASLKAHQKHNVVPKQRTDLPHDINTSRVNSPLNSNMEFRRYRRDVHRDTRRSQKEIYNSQNDARKGMIEAENKIHKTENAVQQSINQMQQEQQKAINRARNSGRIR